MHIITRFYSEMKRFVCYILPSAIVNLGVFSFIVPFSLSLHSFAHFVCVLTAKPTLFVVIESKMMGLMSIIA